MTAADAGPRARAIAAAATLPKPFDPVRARARRHRGPRAPVVLLSTEDGLAAAAAAEGETAALAEPFDLDDLLAAIARFLPPVDSSRVSAPWAAR